MNKCNSCCIEIKNISFNESGKSCTCKTLKGESKCNCCKKISKFENNYYLIILLFQYLYEKSFNSMGEVFNHIRNIYSSEYLNNGVKYDCPHCTLHLAMYKTIKHLILIRLSQENKAYYKSEKIKGIFIEKKESIRQLLEETKND